MKHRQRNKVRNILFFPSVLKGCSALVCLYLLSTVVLSLLSAPAAAIAAPVQIFNARFNPGAGANPGFTSGVLWGTNNSWRLGIAEPGWAPGDTFTGYSFGTARNVNAAGNISGSYRQGEHSYVMSPRLNLSSYTGKNFQLLWDDAINTYPGDTVRVQVTHNNGLTWTDAYFSYGGRVTDLWRNNNFANLSSDYARSDFRIRWRIDGDNGPNYNPAALPSYRQYGFYFDNVELWYDTTFPNLITPQVPNGGDYLSWIGPPTQQQNVTTTTTAGSVEIQFPGAVDMLHGGSPYRSDFYAPFVVDVSAADLGIFETLIDLLVFEIGLEDDSLEFTAPVRLLFPDQGGKQFGWSRNGVFHPSTLLSGDDGSLLTALGTSDGYLYSGDDLVAWTTHFTQFVMYTPEPPPPVVPSPATILLLGSGLVGLAGFRRKIQK